MGAKRRNRKRERVLVKGGKASQGGKRRQECENFPTIEKN